MRYDYAIIGGGASGAILATQLLLQADSRLALCCVEPDARLGAGLAYGRCSSNHALNVPANRISAIADDSDHFLHWLQRRQLLAADPADFYARRQLYADYLSDCLHRAETGSKSRHGLKHLTQAATALRQGANGWHLQMHDGSLIEARQVVLALGNLPAARPPAGLHTLESSPRYLHDPWRLQSTHVDEHDRIAIIGSGLTALDTLQSLIMNRHEGAIEVFSRSGQWPAMQIRHRQAYPFAPTASSLRELVREVRQLIREANQQGICWHNVIDGLRPHTQRLWSGLSPAEKSRFRRHLLSTWNRHRHRIPPLAGKQLQQWQQDGHFTLMRARKLHASISDEAIGLRQHANAAWRQFQLVINATGPCCQIPAAVSPLLQQLLADGTIRSGPCGIGIDTLDDGRIVNASGSPVAGLFAIGPMRQGSLLECTAIPEIRQQAHDLASTLLQSG